MSPTAAALIATWPKKRRKSAVGVEVIRDEDGNEYTERVPDYPEPPEEPLCWAHHSNVCGCAEGELEPRQDLNPATGEPYPFSTEPPFPPGSQGSSNDLDLEPTSW